MKERNTDTDDSIADPHQLENRMREEPATATIIA
jgi:hypothetical protein